MRFLALGLVLLAGCGAAAQAPRQATTAPASCHLHGKGLFAREDIHCTPGAWVDKDGADVCSRGYNPRPPASVTEPVKRRMLKAYGIPLSDISRYELDHLFPRWLGGATVEENLWPELNGGPQSEFVHNPKDQLENDLYGRVCFKHSMTVAQARVVFEHDWRKGYRRYEK